MKTEKSKRAFIGAEELTSYYSLKLEIAMQARRIDALEYRIKEQEKGFWIFGDKKRKRVLPEGIVQSKIGLEVCMILNLEKQAAQIEIAIQRVENPLYRELLRQRYIDGADWNTVAHNLNYVVRQCMRLHKSAVEAFENTQRVACMKV